MPSWIPEHYQFGLNSWIPMQAAKVFKPQAQTSLAFY